MNQTRNTGWKVQERRRTGSQEETRRSFPATNATDADGVFHLLLRSHPDRYGPTGPCRLVMLGPDRIGGAS